MKKRLAIWMHGGIGNGDFSQGYPMLEKVVDKLSQSFAVTVYSHVPPNADYRTQQFALKFPPRSVTSAKVRWLYLLYYFYTDQRKEKFSSLLSFWGYPTAFFGAIINKIFKIPTIASVLGADSASIPSINYGIFHRRFPRMISKWAYMNNTVLLAISEFQKNKLIGFGINRDIRVIPWGADPTMYQFSVKKSQGVLEVIHVAHLNPVKDQTTLLKAFSKIAKKTPARLRIFGLDCKDGIIQNLQALCIEEGIEDKVEFRGVVPYQEMPDHYKNSDLMLHTSLSEGQCMALTEAAACGVLMAGTKVGFLYDLGEEYGVAVDLGDYENLARKVLALLDNPTEWNRKVENARVWSARHDFQWTVNELTLLIDNL
jgi:glycosyltransferase involved in cell wall biosynthesis